MKKTKLNSTLWENPLECVHALNIIFYYLDILNNFFCKNMIDLKILDFLSYTYMHPIQLKEYNFFDYSSVDNHPKWPEIGEMAKKVFFGL